MGTTGEPTGTTGGGRQAAEAATRPSRRVALLRRLGHHALVDAKPRILRLLYRSRRALAADHAAYWVHGGMMVPSPEGSVPPLNSRLVMEVKGPGGLHARLPARVGRAAPGQGFLVSFEPDAAGAQASLDAALGQPEFIAARDLEPAARPPDVVLLDDDAEATDPALPVLEEAAPSPPVEPSGPATAPDGAAPLAPSAPAPGKDDPTEAPVKDDPTEAPAKDAPNPRRRRPSAVRGAKPRAFSGRRPAPGPNQTVIRRARPGERYLSCVVRYPTMASYLPEAEQLEASARLVVPTPDEGAERNDPVLAKLTLPGHNVIEVWSVIEESTPAQVTLRFDPDDERYRRACLYPSSHQARNRAEREAERGDEVGERSVLWIGEEMPDESDEKMPLRRRIKRMGMEDKINLALSGNREERMALAQDSNKSIHHHLLRNAKLTIDEIAFMSRLTSLNPDVLDKIAENPGYTQNPQVTKALVFNPRTPIRTAIRLLDRLPRSDLNILSRRSGMNKRLVMAAKNKLTGSKW